MASEAWSVIDAINIWSVDFFKTFDTSIVFLNISYALKWDKRSGKVRWQDSSVVQ